MADFSALKTAIQNYIKQNGNEEITGEILQTILLSVVTTLGDSAIDDLITALNNEVAARQNADSSLEGAINQEGTLRSNADSTLQGNINTEATARQDADAALQAAIDVINSYIPSQATSSNKLADKAFVNSSIATATATFRGSYNVVSDLSLSYNATHAQIQTALATKMSALSITPDNNDYAFVQIPTADTTPTQIAKIEKYKYNGTAWAFEYELNNSGFTAAQWAAINSGATLELIGKLSALPTNAELMELLAAKQNVIQDIDAIRRDASAGATAVQPATLNTALSNTVAESGVYDVTANNDNAKFASLSALLNSENLDTLIPLSKRKGGMSIKFVRTSDNKYVQFRYMSSSTAVADFTNVTNWQGVDDEPTADSDNLVKSGGVFNDIYNLKKEIGFKITENDFITIGSNTFPKENIATTNPSAYGTTYGNDICLPVKANSVIRIKANANQPTLAIFLTVTPVPYGYKPAEAGTFGNGTESGFLISAGSSMDFTINSDCYLHLAEGANKAYMPDEITLFASDSIINDILNNVDILFKYGFKYGGVVDVDSNPNNLLQPTFFIAKAAGTYTNLGGLVVNEGEFAILKFNGTSWSKDSVCTIEEKISFADRSILIASQITDDAGYITSTGSAGIYAGYYHATPIPIPDGVKYILFDKDDIGNAPNYVNCYSENNLNGFLGRSDGKEYSSLNSSPENVGIAMELQPGTKYISYLTISANVRVNSSTPKIYGAENASNGLLILNTFFPFGSESDSYKIGEPDTTVHFQIQVNVNLDNNTDETTEVQDSQNLQTEQSMIMLPSNYSRTGKPVPLVIGCHGAGGNVTVSTSQTEEFVLYKYLVANGYAVMDTNGIPQQYCTENGIDYNNNIGSPIAVECYIKAYQYVIEHFNVKATDVIIAGGSMGGISSTNVLLSGRIPIIAHAVMCPVLDTYNNIFLNPWSGGAPKTAMGKIYGLSVVDGQYVYDEEKIRGYNPIVNRMTSYDTEGKRVTSVGTYNFSNGKLNGNDVIECKTYPCTLKIWHAIDDSTVNYYGSVRHVQAIKNAGGRAYLRIFPEGGHNPQNVGQPLQNPSGNTNYRGTTLEIKPLIEEEFLFIRRYSKV